MRLVCPECETGDDLATLDRTPGSCLIDQINVEPGKIVEIAYFGETVMDWDGQLTYGVECRNCGWRKFLGEPDKPAPDQDEDKAPFIEQSLWLSWLKVDKPTRASDV